MAESERDGNLWSSTDFNPSLMDIDVVVANILTDVQTSTRQDIVESLIEHISENTISTTRQTLFENSIERYMERVKNAGIEVETATPLSMKRRQGVNATVSFCTRLVYFQRGTYPSFSACYTYHAYQCQKFYRH